MDVDTELAPLDIGETYGDRPEQDDGGRGLGQSAAPGGRAVTAGLTRVLLSPGNHSHPRARVASGIDPGDLDGAGPDEGLHALGGAAGPSLILLARRLPQPCLGCCGGAQLEGCQAQVGQPGGGWAPGASGEPALELPTHTVGELCGGGGGLQHPGTDQLGAVGAVGLNSEASDGEAF